MNLQMNLGKTKYPTKKTINMAMREESGISIPKLIIGLAIIAVLAFCAAKFGAIDQLNRLNKAESQYNQIYNQNQEMLSSIADYDEVVREYRLYSTDWMDEYGSDATVSRQDVLDMVDNYLASRGTVLNINVSGDTAVVKMSGLTLNEISQIFEELKSCEIVSSAELNTATSDAKTDVNSEVSITIFLQEVES